MSLKVYSEIEVAFNNRFEVKFHGNVVNLRQLCFFLLSCPMFMDGKLHSSYWFSPPLTPYLTVCDQRPYFHTNLFFIKGDKYGIDMSVSFHKAQTSWFVQREITTSNVRNGNPEWRKTLKSNKFITSFFFKLHIWRTFEVIIYFALLKPQCPATVTDTSN